MISKRPTIGIALDSGGAMGGAHIGVLEVLREHDIPLDIIVGSSAGAAVGAFYATGSLDAFRDLISDLSFTEALSFYADPVFPISGLLAGKRARKFLRNLVGDVLIEELPLQYVAVATDLLTGETVPIRTGPLVDAVMASISMPGIFKPVVHMDRLLTDGGVSDPLPIDILKSLSPDITIACNLHAKMPHVMNSNQKKAIVKAQKRSLQQDEDLPSWMIDRLEKILGAQKVLDGLKSFRKVMKKINENPAGIIPEIDLINAFTEQLKQSKDRINSIIEKSFLRKGKADTLNIFEIMMNATNIQQYQKNRLMLLYEKPDVLIEPNVTEVRSLEFTKGESTIEEGRQKAADAVPKILNIMEENSRSIGSA
ncbi:MAG: patatin-like phospholipase family protein [Deltaproteobacteria bacterium]|nr:patatin-like phospholipase family protein [Deltaproteobacteria bacterium]